MRRSPDDRRWAKGSELGEVARTERAAPGSRWAASNQGARERAAPAGTVAAWAAPRRSAANSESPRVGEAVCLPSGGWTGGRVRWRTAALPPRKADVRRAERSAARRRWFARRWGADRGPVVRSARAARGETKGATARKESHWAVTATKACCWGDSAQDARALAERGAKAPAARAERAPAARDATGLAERVVRALVGPGERGRSRDRCRSSPGAAAPKPSGAPAPTGRRSVSMRIARLGISLRPLIRSGSERSEL